MNMKIKSLFMMMTVAILLASCSKSEMEEQEAISPDEITLASSVMTISPVSRAAYEGTDLSTKPLTALVLASNTTKNYTGANLRCEGTMTFNGKNVIYNKPVYRGDYSLPTQLMTNVFLSGLYPAAIGNTPCWNTTTEEGKAKMILTGKEDVMFATEQNTNRGSIADKNYAELAFKHQLTLMKLSLAGNTDAVTAKTTVTGIELIAVQGSHITDEVEVDLANQTVNFGGQAATLACYDKDSDNIAFGEGSYQVDGTSTEKAYIMAPPVTATALADNKTTYEYTFKVYYDVEEGNPVQVVNKDLEVKVDLMDMTGTTAYNENTAGKAFNIKLQFVGGQIQATASVTDWALAGNVNMDI